MTVWNDEKIREITDRGDGSEACRLAALLFNQKLVTRELQEKLEALKEMYGECRHYCERDGKCYHCVANDLADVRLQLCGLLTVLRNLLTKNNHAHRKAAMESLGLYATL